MRFRNVFCFFLIFSNLLVGFNESEVLAAIDENSHTITYGNKVFILSPNNVTETPAVPNMTPQEEEISRAEFWFDIIVSILITLFAGAMSGLTVGYLSIDELILELKMSTGTEEEKIHAQKIQPVIEDHHWLLVTLLVCNAAANETLPLVLDRIVSPFMAVVISVTLILFFGEIIPQALCTGPNQMRIASFLAPFTLSLMYITIPISKPLGILMDYVIGKHSRTRFCNTDLKGLIELHTMEAIDKIKKEDKDSFPEENAGVGLTQEQANIIVGAIDVQKRKAKDIMIEISKVEMIEYNESLTPEKIQKLLKHGHSRIPVYLRNKDKVLGILRVKQLINVDLSQNLSLKDLNIELSHPLVLSPETTAMSLLDEFKKGKSHMAFITNDVKQARKLCGLNKNNSFDDKKFTKHLSQIIEENPDDDLSADLLGIITLEDVIEHMINIQILDEDDYRIIKHKEEKRKKKDLARNIAKDFIDKKKFEIGSLVKGELNNLTPKNYDIIENEEGKNLLLPSSG